MSKILNVEDFDILGIVEIEDNAGIEKYVTDYIDEDGKTKYLSRSKEYYNVKTLSELSQEREFLKSKLTTQLSKKNFVILENMLNSSARSYFKLFEEFITNNHEKITYYKMQIARLCLEEDVENIVKLFENKGIISIERNNVLPLGNENCAKRAIEMDNKMLLYIFANSIMLPENIENTEIVTPGYGSTYIGPFIKEIRGCNYTNIYKSKYIGDTTKSSENILKNLISNGRILEENKDIIILDDNIGTGNTMKELRIMLKSNDLNVLASGAIQYNWRNYKRISTGEKEDIVRFNIEDFEYVTNLNYAGHKLYSHAIDLLHSSGKEYIEYLKSKSYRKENILDIEGAIYRSVISAKQVGIELETNLVDNDVTEEISQCEVLDKYKNQENKFNQLTVNIMEKIEQKIEANKKSKDEKIQQDQKI